MAVDRGTADMEGLGDLGDSVQALAVGAGLTQPRTQEALQM
jgi:hypothetical protein